MIIRTSDHSIQVKSITSESLLRDGKKYPAYRIYLESSISDTEISSILAGPFDILDDDGNVLGTHEGYTTFSSLSLVIGKITTADQQIAALESELELVKSENSNYKSEIEILEAENAELLFNETTGADFNFVEDNVVE